MATTDKTMEHIIKGLGSMLLGYMVLCFMLLRLLDSIVSIEHASLDSISPEYYLMLAIGIAFVWGGAWMLRSQRSIEALLGMIMFTALFLIVLVSIMSSSLSAVGGFPIAEGTNASRIILIMSLSVFIVANVALVMPMSVLSGMMKSIKNEKEHA